MALTTAPPPARGNAGRGNAAPRGTRPPAGPRGNGVRNTSTVTHVIPAGSALLNPNKLLSGPQLLGAAKQIAKSETQGPIDALKTQIATNNKNTLGEQNTDFGYYLGLVNAAKSALDAQNAAAPGYAQQIANIGSAAQSGLQNINSQATGGVLARMAAQGTGGDSIGQINADSARAENAGALYNQAAQDYTTQTAADNAKTTSGLAAAGGQYGEEALSALGRAGQIANEGLNSKIADELDKRGALTGTALGQLRTAERNYAIARAGVGLKQADVAGTLANDRARTRIEGENADTAANRAATYRRSQEAEALARTAALNERAHNDQATQLNRAMEIAARSGGALTPHEQTLAYSDIDRIQALIKQARAAGHSGPSVRLSLEAGNYARGVPAFSDSLVQAAYEMMGWGHITPGTARSLHAYGLRGGRLPVAAAPSNANPLMPNGPTRDPALGMTGNPL